MIACGEDVQSNRASICYAKHNMKKKPLAQTVYREVFSECGQ